MADAVDSKSQFSRLTWDYSRPSDTTESGLTRTKDHPVPSGPAELLGRLLGRFWTRQRPAPKDNYAVDNEWIPSGFRHTATILDPFGTVR